MRKNRSTILRLFAIVAMTFAFAGALATPAAAQNDVSGPCQITGGGLTGTYDCQVAVDEASGTCDISAGGQTFQDIDGCADIVQGQCPFQLVDDGVIIQIQCDEDDTFATSTPPATATNVPPTATNVPPTVTNVPATATDVPATATSVPGTATATDVPGTATDVPATATHVPDDDDDKDVDKDDDDKVVEEEVEVVAELPSTGQGPDGGQSNMLVLLLGAMSALLAGAALVWQRRGGVA